jgi:hypothetical protein
MTEAIIILRNMRGGCATVGDKVHALFRVDSRFKRNNDELTSNEGSEGCEKLVPEFPRQAHRA